MQKMRTDIISSMQLGNITLKYIGTNAAMPKLSEFTKIEDIQHRTLKVHQHQIAVPSCPQQPIEPATTPTFAKLRIVKPISGETLILKPLPKKPKVLRNLRPAAPALDSSQKLYIVDNGELKSIRSSNISSSGIWRPLKKKVAQKSIKKTDPKPAPCTKIHSTDIASGIMAAKDCQDQMEFKVIKEMERKKKLKLAKRRTVINVIRPDDLELESLVNPSSDPKPPPKNRPGRKKGVLNQKHQPINPDSIPGSKTRSGRISRPPRHIHGNYSNDPSLKDREMELQDESGDEIPVRPLSRKKSIKFNNTRFRCQKCGKQYVTEARLRHHWSQQPDHDDPPSGTSENTSQETHSIDCFGFLMDKLKKIPLNLRGKIFLDEMEEFMSKVQNLMKKLIRNLDETRNKDSFLNYSQVHQVPKHMENILNIPAGQYHFNMEVIDKQVEDIQPVKSPDLLIPSVPISAFNDPNLMAVETPIMSLERDDDDDLFQGSMTMSSEFYEEYDEEENDDLITPKKTPQHRTHRKVKTSVKNVDKARRNFTNLTDLNTSPSITTPILPAPPIPDLSLELFQSHHN